MTEPTSTPAGLPPTRTYAVIYSNYYPRETYGIFATEELAQRVADRLNTNDPDHDAWNVEPRSVQTDFPAALQGADR
jgi:hypothetical protein